MQENNLSKNLILFCLQEDANVFSAMIWTVHFAYDNTGWPSFERAAQMISDTSMLFIYSRIHLCSYSTFFHCVFILVLMSFLSQTYFLYELF